jgi:hypothetical protein
MPAYVLKSSNSAVLTQDDEESEATDVESMIITRLLEAALVAYE